VLRPDDVAVTSPYRCRAGRASMWAYQARQAGFVVGLLEAFLDPPA
jgi:hypothetical protein